ncbi:valine--tRNA ligase [Candidatus Saccharibacteria bacterium]|nr:valine--tRNA ligase [Candidatus Saccharibacteria bacterium]
MALSKAYQPAEYERDIYRLWEESGAFGLKEGGQRPFVVALPPPNANADLHTGHALDFQLKDVIGRWQRLRGRPTLLIPGADHAGFETWAVYEKHLNAAGKSRFDFEREELYRQVYDFVMANKANMEQQIRRLGVSCDWSRLTFTLDDKIVKRAYQTFKQMWEGDLIYRGKRLVNYCTAHGTGFADYEVTHREVDGKLWFIKYPAADGEASLTIATTRPETLLGDVAVAVHPDDKRYAELLGRQLQLPLTERLIPVIGDSRVDPDFGSGAVKITPGHDFLDFDIGREAGLEVIEAIGKDGKLTDRVPTEFQGLSVKEARQAVLRRLTEQGLLVKEEAYRHQVGHCYKCDTVLEPLLADQWFVRMQPLAEKAIKAIEQGEIKFYPAAKGEELVVYLKQIQDWNISRQIAWGIPIPVFQSETDENDWRFDERVDQAVLEIEGQKYRRDPDVFDTWWSSGQWAFATVDWPERPDLYPNSLMETGAEILRPWVSRMILLSLFVTDQVPFEAVYLHGMVQDDRGVKMSKSKGNVINPMDLIEDYGADALRIGLCRQLMPGQPQKLSPAKIAASRNFCNKLWNIGRFVQSGGEEKERLSLKGPVSLETAADHWIRQRFAGAKRDMDRHLEDYQLARAYDSLFEFVWNDLADWYLESCKWHLNRPFLNRLFADTLRLAHPFAPFLTEALYQQLFSGAENPLLIDNCWSEAGNEAGFEKEEVAEFEQVRSLVQTARRLLPLDLRRKSRLLFKSAAFSDKKFDSLCRQLTAASGTALAGSDTPSGLQIGREAGFEAWMDLDQQLLEKQLSSLEKEVSGAEKSIAALRQRLQNRTYLQKAPKELVEESRSELERAEARLTDLRTDIDSFRRAV